MPVQDRPISEFPRALEVLATALVLISNPSGVDTYDSNSCTLTELGKTILDIEYTQELGQMSVFEAILNVRVLSGTADPTSAVGVDNQLYVKYQTIGVVDSVVAVYVKLDGDWVEIQTGGGGASVTLGTTVPSDSTGSNGDLYVQYDSVTYAVVEYFVKINNSWRKSPYSRVVALTQAEYDLITPDTSTLYIITDAQSSYQTKQDSNLQTTATTIVGAINELNSGKADESEVTSLLSQLDNVTITHYNCEGNGGLLTLPSYEDFCLIFISRGEGGLYMGHWNGVTPIVAAANHQVIYYSNPSRINVTNNSSATDRVTVIRK